MVIHFERSGGFTGIVMKAHIDIDSLPPEEAKELTALVEHSGIKDFRSERKESNASDQFCYSLTLETESEKQSLLFSDRQVTGEIKPLIDYLNRKARARR